MSESIFIKHAAQLVTVSGHTENPAKRDGMRELNCIEDGALLATDGKIIAVGTTEGIQTKYENEINQAKQINASGKVVSPGLIDPHTHLVHAGTRENEYAMRLKGKTYMDIMNQGGGIHATTRATQQADVDQLYQESKQRLDTFLVNGVTTVEAKSGYGLTTEHEIKQLEVSQHLNENHVMDIVSTFMGAHAVPVEEKANPDAFVDRVISEMIPEVAKRKLAQFNDVFCERGVFTPEQSRRILEAGKEFGLIPKIHADEIEPYGGAELAAAVGAVSADHLLKASDEGIRQMADQDVIGVLLPGTAFFLMAEFAQARKMIDQGLAVALSTDANPGSSPTLSLQFIMNLGCLKMGMTPEEVITATTINAAHAIGRANQIGSLEIGKQADITIFDVPNYLTLSYQYGMNHVDTVIKCGQVVVEDGNLQTRALKKVR
ncbi:imidazolonepropionase [Virgibacillus salexigens]|uniref:Imidazolonepropionase n=1 Tax=Virgibacillus massiliensis TaxID=1462526 RepID=A0A024Q879_9BACI|nr:imidazolonepropionase [Virgibacillus massiliensis]MYL40506.1 imidazolonepropionase [Virgibacillus massiliensis]CDQ38704.1 Imidazolonepropionase [Virgibacillus massiliensis]